MGESGTDVNNEAGEGSVVKVPEESMESMIFAIWTRTEPTTCFETSNHLRGRCISSDNDNDNGLNTPDPQWSLRGFPRSFPNKR